MLALILGIIALWLLGILGPVILLGLAATMIGAAIATISDIAKWARKNR